jgi:hypothetical protein
LLALHDSAAIDAVETAKIEEKLETGKAQVARDITNFKKCSKNFTAEVFVNSFEVRGHIILQFLNGMLDIPVFTIGILFVVVLAPWRLKVLFQGLHEKVDDSTIFIDFARKPLDNEDESC